MKAKSPVVDDDDVNRIVDFIRKHADFTRSTPEQRARVAAEMAEYEGTVWGLSAEWTKEFARRVKKRMLWKKPSN
jgi:hemerythrin-like domain-containing protein